MKNLKVEKLITKLKEIKKDYPIMTLYVVGNFLNAILLRTFTTGHFHLRSVFFDFAFIMILVGFSFLVSNKRRRGYYTWTTILMVATCVINSLYYNYYNSFVSFSLLATSVFVKDVGDAVVEMVVRPCDLSYLWLFIALFFAKRKMPEEFNPNKHKCLKTMMISLIAIALGSTLPPYNSFSRLYKLWNRVLVVDSWGPYVYQVDDLIQSLKPTFNNIFGYDKALKDTNDYYKANSKKVQVNDYTGIFEGKNVLVIHLMNYKNYILDQHY